MKTKIQSLFALTGILVLTASCASEEEETARQGQIQEQETKGLTAFVVEGCRPETRTTADYDGTGLNFYWTEGDHLWVNDGNLRQDTKNNITNSLVNNPTTPDGIKRTATAKFYFDGDFTASSYPVRYTGKGNTVGDRITIKTQQNQNVVNDASHLGESGDCGTATATKVDGKYNFSLDHKATYLTFIPYTPQNSPSRAIVTQIKVTADKAIAGQFRFNDNGIDMSSRPTPASSNKSIILNLKDAAPNTGFPISKGTADYGKNAAIMVLAPGTYSTLSIDFSLRDNKTNISSTVSKTYNNITLNAGRNRCVVINIQETIHPGGNYFMWDAVKPYWHGRNLPDILTNETDYQSYGIPTKSDADRWYNTKAKGQGKAFDGTNSCSIAPNANELWYYVTYGDPHYVSNVIWSYNGHLYKGGGLWLKKQEVIFRELKDKGYKLTTQQDMKARFYKSKNDEGRDYCKTFNNTKNEHIKHGTPTKISDYFFLPALGWFNSGHLREFGQYGYYWSKSADPHDSGNACYISFCSERMELENDDRDRGYTVCAFE